MGAEIATVILQLHRSVALACIQLLECITSALFASNHESAA